MILAQVNLFYALTPDWEISLSYMSLHKPSFADWFLLNIETRAYKEILYHYSILQ